MKILKVGSLVLFSVIRILQLEIDFSFDRFFDVFSFFAKLIMDIFVYPTWIGFEIITQKLKMTKIWTFIFISNFKNVSWNYSIDELTSFFMFNVCFLFYRTNSNRLSFHCIGSYVLKEIKLWNSFLSIESATCKSIWFLHILFSVVIRIKTDECFQVFNLVGFLCFKLHQWIVVLNISLSNLFDVQYRVS